MILCQQCTHENPYNSESCVACGAKLLVITSTRTAAAYGGIDSLLRPTLEEHLLERISNLESQLERAQDRLDLVLDLVHRQATSGLYDHAMLDALVPTAPFGAIADLLRERYRGVADALTLRLPKDPSHDTAFARVIETLRES